MRVRRIVALLFTLAIVGAACGDDGSTSPTVSTTTTAPDNGGDEDATSSTSSTTTTTAAPVELTASWPGVTEDAIRLGFLEVDMETLVDLGLIENNRGDPKVVIDTLIDELNARGGINNRRIELFYENVLPIDTNEAEAACVRLTEDDDVFAVLGSFVGPTVGANPCISTLGETIMVGGAPTAEEVEQARAPWLSTGMSSGRSLPAVIKLMDDAGLLAGRLGVVWAVEDESAAVDVVLPELERLGLDVAVEVVQLADAGDRRALTTEWQTIVERFRTEGVDTAVLALSSAGINGPNQMSILGYDGDIVIVSHGLLTSIGITAQVPLEELAGIYGSMSATPEEAFDLPATQACIEIFEAAHPEITVVPLTEVAEGEKDWITPIQTHCARLRLFEMVAAAAGPDLTHETFLSAAEGLGEIELPASPFASLGPGKLDTSDNIRLAIFDPTITESGAASPAGELLRAAG